MRNKNESSKEMFKSDVLMSDGIVSEVVAAKLKLKFQENVFKSLHLRTNILANLFSILIKDFTKGLSLWKTGFKGGKLAIRLLLYVC